MNPVVSQAIENRDYALHSLGWKSFQDLCSTILGDLWGQDFQTFSPVKDDGRDGYFCGQWKESPRISLHGQFTVQCKFSSDPSATLTPSSIAGELAKASELANQGLCENYILIFNHSISASNHKAVVDLFSKITGVREVRLFGRQWITRQITESARLRMLVPRVYGLGDLSYILDERAKRQAEEILKSMDEDLAKFVKTKAYKDSAKALSKKKALILLGQAASGKSTIAATLSLAALDQWKSPPIFIKDPEKFEQHWNPNDPRQVFWIDDAFGSTSYKKERVDEWNYLLRHMRAALNQGARFIFTSRDYIFKDALRHLKTSEFPLFEDSQVVIRLDELTTEEKRQILYNHIKLGTQPAAFKKKIVPFLDTIAENPAFLPEIARRLGSPVFTNGLSLTADGLKSFVEKPKEMLIKLLSELDTDSRAAIALIFMNEGKLRSPLELSDIEVDALKKLGASEGGVRIGLQNLEESLVKKVFQDESFYWTVKHPTISDAYSEILIRSSELLDIYLLGTSAENLLGEIICGDISVKGARVIIPKDLYLVVAKRLDELPVTSSNVYFHSPLCSFLSARCSKSFLEFYLSRRPEIFEVVKKYGSAPYSGIGALAVTLNKLGLLSEDIRSKLVLDLETKAVDELDPCFRNSTLRELLRADDSSRIFDRIRVEALPNLEGMIESMAESFDPGYSTIDSYFDDVESLLRSTEDQFSHLESDDDFRIQIEEAYSLIESIKSDLHKEHPDVDEDDSNMSVRSTVESSKLKDDHSRSIFSDVAS